MSTPIDLPPGFRFHPTDEELIVHYLKKKVSSSPNPTVSIIADIDLYKFNPWDLPGSSLFLHVCVCVCVHIPAYIVGSKTIRYSVFSSKFHFKPSILN